MRKKVEGARATPNPNQASQVSYEALTKLWIECDSIAPKIYPFLLSAQ